MLEELPKGWVKTTLSEIRHDESMGVSQEQMRGEMFELYSVPAFREGKPEVVPGDAIGSNKILVSPGDVLLCKINPRINRAWVVGEPHGHRQIASTEWIVFSKQKGISPEFLCYFFSQDEFRDYLAANVSGVGGSLMRVRPSVVGTYPFTLPPAAEQKRIVEKLNAALPGIERAERAAHRARKRLQRYRAAVLHAAVTGELTRDWREAQRKKEGGKPETGDTLLQRLLAARHARWEESELERLRVTGKEPKDDKWKSRYDEPAPPDTADLPDMPPSWAWARLQQLGFVVGGLTKNPKRKSLRLKLPYLRVANVYANELRLDNVVSIGVDMGELDKLLLEKGDLLIVEGNGSKDQIGRLAIWDGSIERCVHQNHIIKVRLVEKQLGTWVLSWLLSPPGRQHIEKVASSTTGLYTLSLNKVGDLPIPLPSATEQTEINREVERRLAAADRLAAKLDRQLERARATRQSLLRDAFASHLVPQDPNDEPASVLLERIRAAREAEAKKPRAKRMPKPKSKSKAARHALLDVLREHKKPMTPEQLFREAGFEASQVDIFYRELTSLRDKLREQKPKASEAKLWPHRADVLLQLKEGAEK